MCIFEVVVRTSDRQIVERVARIHALSKVIRGIPIPPSVQNRLDRLNILRAVRGTTGIEGTELSEEEVGGIMDAPPDQRVLPPSRSREEQEVGNAHQLMLYVAQFSRRNPKAPLTESLIQKLHEITTRKIDYPNNVPGQYRTFPVTAGTYSPPAGGEEIRRLMSEFITWFNEESPRKWDPIISAIVAHFFVISIHPFGDGNGRTSRAVESYLLYQAGVNARGYYSLANYYYRKRPEYVSMLDHVRFKSDPDLTPFVNFALEGLEEELNAVHEEVLSAVRIIAFRDFAREQLLLHDKLRTRAGERLSKLLFTLANSPVPLRELRAGRHPLSGLYKELSPKTLARDINLLKEYGLAIVEGNILKANLGIMDQFTGITIAEPFVE